MDFWYDKIFNGWILIGILMGFLFRICEKDYRGVWEAVVVMLISFGLLFPVYKIGALGAGDVKLFLVTGSFVPLSKQFVLMGVSFAVGAVFSIAKMISEENFKERMNYLFSYFVEVLYTRKWKLYGENLKEDYQKYKSNKIHFALPIWISVVLGLGGFY